jgi:hypothetical protein
VRMNFIHPRAGVRVNFVHLGAGEKFETTA